MEKIIKTLIFVSGMVLLLSCFAIADNYQLGDDVDIVYSAVDSDNITFLSGETLFSSIIYVDSGTTYYYDFDDDTFKSTAVVTQWQSLTEDTSAEIYSYTWTSPNDTPRTYVILTKNNTTDSVAQGLKIKTVVVEELEKTIKLYGR